MTGLYILIGILCGILFNNLFWKVYYMRKKNKYKKLIRESKDNLRY